MIETLDDFREAMDKIGKMGWIKTHRSGPTGIGKTLEDLLGITENNASEPDFGVYELKAARDSDLSMLTLFTKTPQPPKINGHLLEKFGYISNAYDNEKKSLHSTISANRPTRIAGTGKTLEIVCHDDKISIVSDDGTEEAYWDINALRQAFNRKYQQTLVYVKARTRGKGKDEEFQYYVAYELSGFDYNSLIELLREGILKIDIRIGQYSDGRPHDHGTGFRIHPQYFDNLFLVKEKIWEL